MHWKMMRFLLFATILLLSNKQCKGTEVTYTAAVLEYEPYSEVTEEQGKAVVRTNAEVIADYAMQAKLQGADIIVTPEYGIESLDANKTDMTAFITYMQYVPDPLLRISPCSYEGTSNNVEAMQILSCAAIEHSIYIVVDLGEMEACSDETLAEAPWGGSISKDDCPESGFFFYNAQIVFDRSGTIIARYRKQNLFLEPQFTPGPQDNSLAIFDTDFNVRFSMQVCFDIVFENPGYNNVRYEDIYDVVMSTAWVDTLPAFLADAIQNGWSEGLGVNLLVSGYHYPERTKLGSGIFRGYKHDTPEYTYNKDSGNVLLVKTVTTKMVTGIPGNARTYEKPQPKIAPHSHHQAKTIETPEPIEEDRTHRMIHLDMSEFAGINLEQNTNGEMSHVNLCTDNNELCCDMTYMNNVTEIYKLIAHSGFISVGDGAYSIAVQICSVIWCQSNVINTCALVELGVPETTSFGPFSLSATFIAEQVYATGLKTDLLLLPNEDLTMERTNDFYTLSSNKTLDQPLVVGLLGRWYSNVPN